MAGACAVVVPLALAGAGVALVLRPFISSPAAVNAGAICVLAALLLAYAAGTAGLGPDGHPNRHGYFDPDFFTEHGGVVGETLYWASATLFQRIGAHIIAVLLLVAGLLLLSGSTIAGMIRTTMRAGGRARDGAKDLATAVRETGARVRRTPDAEEPDSEKVLTRVASTEPIATELLGPEPDDEVEGETGEVPVAEPATNGDGEPQAMSFDEAISAPAPSDDDAEAAPHELGEEIGVARTPQGERRGEGGSPSPTRSTTSCPPRRRSCAAGTIPDPTRATARRSAARCSRRSPASASTPRSSAP